MIDSSCVMIRDRQAPAWLNQRARLEANVSMLDFTIAICTYNGEARLPAVLRCLQACYDYRSPDGCPPPRWGVLIVDNNSSDRTAAIIAQFQADPDYPVPLHYCQEPRQGLAFARQRAMERATSDWVAFVDDDNLLQPDWVWEAYQFARTHPQVGAFGGRILPAFETAPPANFAQIACFLSINGLGDRPRTSFLYSRTSRMLPPGAGLVVRRQAWLACVPRELVLRGRIGSWQLASEDLEAILHIQNHGWEIWHNAAMQLDHQIPPQRLERAYLLKIVRGVGLARHRLRMVRLRPWQRPFFVALHLVNDLQKALRFYYHHHQHLDTDTAAACHMAFLLSSIVSPLFLWRSLAGTVRPLKSC